MRAFTSKVKPRVDSIYSNIIIHMKHSIAFSIKESENGFSTRGEFFLSNPLGDRFDALFLAVRFYLKLLLSFVQLCLLFQSMLQRCFNSARHQELSRTSNCFEAGCCVDLTASLISILFDLSYRGSAFQTNQRSIKS